MFKFGKIKYLSICLDRTSETFVPKRIHAYNIIFFDCQNSLDLG